MSELSEVEIAEQRLYVRTSASRTTALLTQSPWGGFPA